MRFISLSVIAAAGFALFSAPAQAALNSYLRVTGETQGEIRGGVTQAGREDTIEVFGFSHEVVSPRDAASGLPTGKRQHKPFTIVTPLDKSTPLLFNALATNENLTEFRLEMWRPSRTGKEFQYYTIELVNASVASIKIESGEGRADEHTATISFAYETIIETWEDGGITAQDDWSSSASGPARGAVRLRRN